MLDGRNIVQAAADTGCEPVRSAMLESSGRQHQVDFFRRVIVVGIADIRSEERRTDHHIASFLNAARPKNYGVGMVLWPVIAGICAACGPRRPIELRFDAIECGYEFRQNWRCSLS